MRLRFLRPCSFASTISMRVLVLTSHLTSPLLFYLRHRDCGMSIPSDYGDVQSYAVFIASTQSWEVPSALLE